MLVVANFPGFFCYSTDQSSNAHCSDALTLPTLLALLLDDALAPHHMRSASASPTYKRVGATGQCHDNKEHGFTGQQFFSLMFILHSKRYPIQPIVTSSEQRATKQRATAFDTIYP